MLLLLYFDHRFVLIIQKPPWDPFTNIDYLKDQHGYLVISIIKCGIKLCWAYQFTTVNSAVVKVWAWIDNFLFRACDYLYITNKKCFVTPNGSIIWLYHFHMYRLCYCRCTCSSLWCPDSHTDTVMLSSLWMYRHWLRQTSFWQILMEPKFNKKNTYVHFRAKRYIQLFIGKFERKMICEFCETDPKHVVIKITTMV